MRWDEYLDRAIESLKAAVSVQPANAVYRSDLAAALWQRGVFADGGLEDRIAALEQSETAVGLAAGAPEPAFNLALALDSLFLWDQALEAYERYLQIDPSSEWARWVRLRIDRLTTVDVVAAAERTKEAMAGAALARDYAGLRNLVRQHPQLAREFGELELLPRWAGIEGGDDEARSLDVASAIGEALAAVNGDRMLLDAAGSAENPDARAGLAAWGAALPLIARREYELALPHLIEARDRLEAAGSSMARWARLHLVIYEYQRDAYEIAYLELARLTEAANAGSYPSLLAHARRVQGLIQQIWGHAEAASLLGGEAVTLSVSLGEVGAAASHGVPLVGTLDRLGEDEQAERLLLAALEQRPTSTRPDHLYVGYWSVNARLGRQGRPGLAERFQLEAVAMAERSGDAVLLAEAYRQLAEILEQCGRLDQAIATLDRSAEQIQAIESESARVYLGTMNRLARGRVLAAVDPQSALAELDAAVGYLRTTRFEHLLPRVLVERSAHHSALEQDREAEADLLEAAVLIESHRGGTEDPHYRLSIYTEAQRIYRELALSVHADDPARAFGYADRARARVLGDWLWENGQKSVAGAFGPLQPPEALIDHVLQVLPEEGALIEYFLTPDFAVAWTISAAYRLRQVRLPLGGEELGRLIARLDRAWGKRDDQTLRGLEELHAALIAPLELGEYTRSLVIVPQGPLERVPFSALREAASQSFLIERFTVSLSPSAELLATRLPRPSTGGLLQRALVIGDPAFDTRLHPGLSRLPGARREAQSIHNIYKTAGQDSELLLDRDANREGLLAKMQQADLIHLAAHGLPALRRPLFSQIVLANPGAGVSSQGLTGLDVFGLDLEGTELVVLSTCEGFRSQRNEGLLGLVLPFLAAGADSVVASVRPADDEQTPALMVNFHQGVSTGLDAGEALRRAKVAFIHRGMSVEGWANFEVFGAF